MPFEGPARNFPGPVPVQSFLGVCNRSHLITQGACLRQYHALACQLVVQARTSRIYASPFLCPVPLRATRVENESGANIAPRNVPASSRRTLTFRQFS